MRSRFVPVLASKPPEPPKFAIQDNDRPLTPYWAGRDWTATLSSAKKFTDLDALCEKCRELLVAAHRHLPRMKFAVQVNVTALVPPGVTQEMIQEWVNRAVNVYADYDTHGLGPVDGSLVVVDIDTTLEDLTEEG